MSVSEKLKDFAGGIALAASRAPDNYDEWTGWTYEAHMADLKELWSYIQPRLERDLDEARFVGGKFQEMIDAFEAGEKSRGRAAAWAIYNSDFRKMR